MAGAVLLGGKGRLSAPPNPWVGCVVVSRTGEVVGRGFHARAGEAHAEVQALAAAGPSADTVYVTLEPCAHTGRTPPCTEALIAAGVRRVVVATEDPDGRVAGRGIAALRGAGIEVAVGVGRDEAERSLAPYLHHRRTGRPYCVLKTAVSLDGRTAGADGASRWITGPGARADAHRLRAGSGAVVIGSGTALADRPSLTARDLDPPPPPGWRQPRRVLLDGRGRVPAEGPLFDPRLAPTRVYTTGSCPPEVAGRWAAAGAEVMVATDADGVIDLDEVLDTLGTGGILQVMVEGGPTVHGAFLRAGLVDRLVVYAGGVLLGAGGAPLAGGATGGPWPATLAGAPRFRLDGVSPLGPSDVRLDWEPVGTGQ